MSSPTTSPSPDGPGQQPGADGAAGGAREHAPGAGGGRLVDAGARPPEESITVGLGQPALGHASASRRR